MYTTRDEILRTSELLDVETVTSAHLNDVMKFAQNRMDARLGKRYQVPFQAPVPEVIQTIATWLASGYLLERYYSDRRDDHEKEGLAPILIRRAEEWMDEILIDHSLDGMPSIEINTNGPSEGGTKAALAITPARERSAMEDILKRW